MEHSTAEVAGYVFLGIVVVIIVARLFGRAARAVRQPAVVGEIVAGVALGPSLLGLLPGELDHVLFPDFVRPYLAVLAQLGLVLFMFIVGLELDVKLIRGNERLAGVVSLSSVALPFALGALLSLVLHPLHDEVDGEAVPLLALALFLGVAMSITAFPVLARILSDRGMQRTATGALALACAAVDDIIAWTLLAFVVAVVKGTSPLDVVRIVALTAVFAAVMFLVVKPALARLLGWYARAGRLTPDLLAVVLVGVLASAWTTEHIGIHAIFGAFVFGAVMPREGAEQLTTDILERLEQVSVLLLLPVFFVISGMGTDIGGLSAAGLWQLGLVLLVAIGGKFVGAFVAARAQGVRPRQAGALGVLMNTRGLTELVILQIGVQLGVLDGELFTILVIMAIVTTVMTEPLLRVVYPARVQQRDVEAAERAGLGIEECRRVLVVVDAPGPDDPPGTAAADRRMVRAGVALLGRGRPAEVVLVRLVEASRRAVELGAGVLPDLAAMATAVDELGVLAAEVRAGGEECRLLTRFADDRWAQVGDLARVTEADVVVVAAGWARAHRPAGAEVLPQTVVVLDLAEVTPGPAPVAVVVDASAAGRVAAVVGALLADLAGSPLVLDGPGGRRTQQLADALARTGVPTSTGDGVGAGVRVVVGTGGPVQEPGAATDLVHVLPGLDDEGTELAEVLTELLPGATPRAAAPSEAPVG